MSDPTQPSRSKQSTGCLRNRPAWSSVRNRRPNGYHNGVPRSEKDKVARKLGHVDSSKLAGGLLLGIGGGLALGGGRYLLFAPGPSGGQVAVSGQF